MEIPKTGVSFLLCTFSLSGITVFRLKVGTLPDRRRDMLCAELMVDFVGSSPPGDVINWTHVLA